MTSEMKKEEDEFNFMNIHRDIGLKTLIFAMIFYIVSSPIIVYKLSKMLPPTIDIILIQTILFAVIYYCVHMYLFDH